MLLSIIENKSDQTHFSRDASQVYLPRVMGLLAIKNLLLRMFLLPGIAEHVAVRVLNALQFMRGLCCTYVALASLFQGKIE